MHSVKHVAGVLGSNVVPGIVLLILGAALLCVWELGHLTGGEARGRRHRLMARLTALTGVVLGAISFLFIAARFIWIA